MDARYWVEGPDGRRFGPVDLGALREWVAEGRLIPDSVLVSEATGERLRAGSRGDLFPATDGLASSTSMASYHRAPAPPRVSWVLRGGVPLLAALSLAALLAAILLPVFARPHIGSRVSPLSNLRQLGVGVLIYQIDADDHFPLDMASARAFEPAVMPYIKNAAAFRSANPAGGEVLGDARLGGRTSKDLADPARTVMLYDSLPWKGGQGVIVRADGSAGMVPFPTIATLLLPDPYGGLTREAERRKDLTSGPKATMQ